MILRSDVDVEIPEGRVEDLDAFLTHILEKAGGFEPQRFQPFINGHIERFGFPRIRREVDSLMIQ